MIRHDDPMRIYEPHECGDDGYPFAWHDLPDNHMAVPLTCEQGPGGILATSVTRPWGIKHIIRAQAEDRCVRCQHPFVVGESGVYEREPIKKLIAENPLQLLEPVDGEPVNSETRNGVNWSACDEHCTHAGPVRVADGERWDVMGADVSPAEVGQWIRAGLTVQAAWRILTVHHLNERKHDCRWWNLAALCQRCHLVIQRKVQMERVYPFEHSDWFKPYAAAWYAYAYRGEELSREEVMANLDELLALERMA